MTAWEALVAKSALTAGTALQHLLLSIQGTGGGGNYFASFFVAAQETSSIIIEPERTPATQRGHSEETQAAVEAKAGAVFATAGKNTVFVTTREASLVVHEVEQRTVTPHIQKLHGASDVFVSRRRKKSTLTNQ